jgi:hypothetical protein
MCKSPETIVGSIEPTTFVERKDGDKTSQTFKIEPAIIQLKKVSWFRVLFNIYYVIYHFVDLR